MIRLVHTAHSVDEDAMTTWAAPGRVNLIGEHTDYNDGFVLPLAIPLRAKVTAASRPDRQASVESAQAGPAASFAVTTAPGEVTGWAAYVAGVLWALRQLGHRLPGLDLHVDSDVPLGAGLSSSAALTCAVAAAVNVVAELGLDRLALARVAQVAENDYVGVPCGLMDQMASMLGRRGHAMLLDTRSLAVEHIAADFSAAGLTLLVIDTRVRHALADGAYAARRAQCAAAARGLGVSALRDAARTDLQRLDDPVLVRRARHVVSENDRVLAAVAALRSHDWAELGRLLAASHRSLRDDFEVSSAELDVAVDTALAHGALGARMTGAGFGGSAIALVPTQLAAQVRGACREAFADRGLCEPHVFDVVAADGAARLD